MIQGFVVLLIFQLAGEVLSRGLALPVPGPVLGLVLLFLALQTWRRLGRPGSPKVGAEAGAGDLGRVADGLLQNLALLFVPAGVGVVQHLGLLEAYGVAFAVVLVGSTAITLVVTVLAFAAVARWVGDTTGEPAS
jgi:putative effector of murein hydrolase LrgA (UPF0299 family)